MRTKPVAAGLTLSLVLVFAVLTGIRVRQALRAWER